MDKRFFVSGIGTSVGKTIVCAALTKLWGAAYWKPVQSGDLDRSDSMLIRDLLGEGTVIYPERFRLRTAVSPHYAAELDAVEIHLDDFQLPCEEGNLIVEGAGGLYVPLNSHEFMLDLIKRLALPVILVCVDYLGSINHSLLSIRTLQNAGISIAYVVFNGEFNEASRRILLSQIPEQTEVLELSNLGSLDAAGLAEAIQEMNI